jgi:hypothetical protein
MPTNTIYVRHPKEPLGPAPYTLSFEHRADAGADGLRSLVRLEWVLPDGYVRKIGSSMSTATVGGVSSWSVRTFSLDRHIGGESGMLRFIYLSTEGATARIRRVHITNGDGAVLYGEYPEGYAWIAGFQDGVPPAISIGEGGVATDTQWSARDGTTGPTPNDAITFYFGASPNAEPTPNIYAPAVLADSPAVYWRLDDGGPVSVADSSGNNRDGTVVASLPDPTFRIPGLVSSDNNRCVNFAGNSAIERPYAAWMDASHITVEALIQTVVRTGFGAIIDRDDGGSARVFQFRRNATHLEFIIIGTSTVVVTGTVDIADGTPHLVHATYDGATVKLYVDGVLDTSAATIVALPTSAARFRIGANRSAPGPSYVIGFTGEIDEAAYYTTVLSAARIAAHAAAR